MSGTSLKPCKKCGKEVSKSAALCSHCGQWLKMRLITKLGIGVGSLVVLGAILSCTEDKPSVTVVSRSDSADQAGRSENEQQKSQAKIGQPFKMEKFEVTVTAVETRNRVGGEFLDTKPAEGGIYVAIKWKYKNITGKPIGSFSCPGLKLVAPNGVKYEPDLDATSSYAAELNLTEKIFSDLNPGITVTGAEVFEVANGSFNKATWSVLVEADEEVIVALK